MAAISGQPEVHVTPEGDAEVFGECDLSRRDFVKTAGALTGAAILGLPIVPTPNIAISQADAVHRVPVQLTINGVNHSLSIDSRVTLLDLLREQLALTGAKKGCDHGQCGAC